MNEQEYADFFRAIVETMKPDPQTPARGKWDATDEAGNLVVTNWGTEALAGYATTAHFHTERSHHERLLIMGIYATGAHGTGKYEHPMQVYIERFLRGEAMFYQVSQIYMSDQNYAHGLRIHNAEITHTSDVKNRELINGHRVPVLGTYKSIERVERWAAVALDNLDVIMEERYADADTIPDCDHQGFQFLEAFKESATTTRGLLERFFQERA